MTQNDIKKFATMGITALVFVAVAWRFAPSRKLITGA